LKRGQGARDAPLVAELIGNCDAGEPKLVSSKSLGVEERWMSWVLDTLKAGADGQSCYLRARVLKRAQSADAGLALPAYTNPVRIFLTR